MLHDHVEIDRAAGGQDQRRLRADGGADLAERLCRHRGEVGDRGPRPLRIPGRRRALIGADARQPQPALAGLDRGDHPLGRRQVAGAGAAGPDLDHHRQRRQPGFVPGGIQRRHGLGGIDEGVELGPGIGFVQPGQAAGAARAADLVGQQQPVQPGAQHHRGLADVGHRGAPGPGRDQRGRQRRRHRRLGMRRDRRPLLCRIAQHQRPVAGEGVLVQGQHRQRHGALGRVPALRRHVVQRDRPGARRHAADAVMQHVLLDDPVGHDRPLPCPVLRCAWASLNGSGGLCVKTTLSHNTSPRRDPAGEAS